MVADKGAGFQPISGIKPTPPPVSLLTAATRLPASVVWKSGVRWRGAACVPGYRWPYCGKAEDRHAAKTISKPAFYPYMIYVPYQCDEVLEEPQTTVDGETITVDSYIADAQAEAEAVTPFHVSQELWTGAIEALNPSLESVAADLGGSAAHPVVALGQLLDAYALSDAQGGSVPIVHAPWSVVVSLMGHGLVNQVGDVYYGPGCLISPGPGYPAGGLSGPAAADAGAGNVWTYISGPVEYALGPIEVTPTGPNAHFDRRTNLFRVWAQRMAIHRFDTGCIFAKKTFLPAPSADEAP